MLLEPSPHENLPESPNVVSRLNFAEASEIDRIGAKLSVHESVQRAEGCIAAKNDVLDR